MRRVVVMVLAAVLVGLAGCTGAVERLPAARDDPRVVSHLGRLGIQFGDTRAELEREYGLVQVASDCAPRLPGHPAVSPVFDGDRLVLLWVDPPLRTPAGLMAGSPVDQVYEAHPGVTELPEPDRPFAYHGLLATVPDPAAGDRAYLFLHDGSVVQKVIVGYEQAARQLYTEQFGVC